MSFKNSNIYLLGNMREFDSLVERIMENSSLSSEVKSSDKHVFHGALVVSGILDYFANNSHKAISNKIKKKVISSINSSYVFSREALEKSETYDAILDETDIAVQKSLSLAGRIYDPDIHSLEKKVNTTTNISLFPLVAIAKCDFEGEFLKSAFFSEITSCDYNTFLKQLEIGYSLNNFFEEARHDRLDSSEVFRFEYNFLLERFREVYRGLEENEKS